MSARSGRSAYFREILPRLLSFLFLYIDQQLLGSEQQSETRKLFLLLLLLLLLLSRTIFVSEQLRQLKKYDIRTIG